MTDAQIFDTLGITLRADGSQQRGECPFCGKDKFYLNPVKLVWDCKVCGESGNEVTVISRLFDKVYKPAMNDKRYGRLASYRGIPEHAFRSTETIGFDETSGKYTWIVRKPNGQPSGLRTWKPPATGAKSPVHNLKGCKLGLLGASSLGDAARKDETVYLCEGEWDYHALAYLLDAVGQAGIVLAVPGASNFPADWADWFKGRKVDVLFDNDEPGRNGTVKVYHRLVRVASRLRFLHWDGKKRDGYDTHDMVKETLGDPGKAWDYLNGNMRGEPTGKFSAANEGVLAEKDDRQKEQSAIPPIGVDALHATFQKWLKLDNCDLLDIVMGCFWSLYLPGSPLWMFIVAPPSGSKSETIMPASEWWRCHAISNMTSKSLVSGFQLNGGGDPSLLGALDGKRAVIAVKDLTPLLQSSQEERDEVFGILRDAYDGSLSKVFGNGLKRTYTNLHFVLLAGVTPAIDAHEATSMGERFLKFRADKDTDRYDDIDRAIRAIENCGSEGEMRKELRDACIGALQREYKEENLPKPDREFAKIVSELAWCVANIRAVAPTEKGSDVQTMAPMVEAPPRLAIQFVKLAQGLALHLEADSLHDERVLRLVRRVALHTANKVTTRVIQTIYASPEPLSFLGVAEAIKGIGRETITKVTARLARTGFLIPIKDGERTKWGIRPAAKQKLKSSRFFEDLPQTDPFFIAPKVAVGKLVLRAKRA